MVTSPPILKYHDRQKDLVLQCDASDIGLRAALMYICSMGSMWPTPAERLPRLKKLRPDQKDFWRRKILSIPLRETGLCREQSKTPGDDIHQTISVRTQEI